MESQRVFCYGDFIGGGGKDRERENYVVLSALKKGLGQIIILAGSSYSR